MENLTCSLSPSTKSNSNGLRFEKKGGAYMEFIIVGKNIDVTPGLRQAVEDKIGKLERYFTPNTQIHVTLSVEKDRQKIEVTIPVKGTVIRSEQVSNDMYVSIDLVEEIIERQLKKYKNKNQKLKKNQIPIIIQ